MLDAPVMVVNPADQALFSEDHCPLCNGLGIVQKLDMYKCSSLYHFQCSDCLYVWRSKEMEITNAIIKAIYSD